MLRILSHLAETNQILGGSDVSLGRLSGGDHAMSFFSS
jgi:hypothetical protein